MLTNRMVYPFVFFTAAREMIMLDSESSVADHQAQDRILTGFQDAFSDAGEYFATELSRASGPQEDGLDRVVKSALGLWKLATYDNQTVQSFDDFCL